MDVAVAATLLSNGLQVWPLTQSLPPIRHGSWHWRGPAPPSVRWETHRRQVKPPEPPQALTSEGIPWPHSAPGGSGRPPPSEPPPSEPPPSEPPPSEPLL